MSIGRTWAIAALIGIGLGACNSTVDPDPDSETHWLGSCSRDADCGSDGACRCGLCTRACDSGAACGNAVAAECTATEDIASCAGETVSGALCVAACTAPSHCPKGTGCSDGFCLPVEPDHAEPCIEVVPSVVLDALAGRQVGVHGSYCVHNDDLGCGPCADHSAELQEVTIVHPGDQATFSMPDGTLVSGERCQPPCPPTLRIQSAGCRAQAVPPQPLSEDESWTIDLEPGRYDLWVDSHYEEPSGWAGQITVRFGLLVDPSQERAVVPVEDALCPILPDAG